MPLGTLDRSPPPFFRQGPSARARLAVFASMAVFLMVADTRLQLTPPLRKALMTALHPVEQALLSPVRGSSTVMDYFGGIAAAQATAQEARAALTKQSLVTLQTAELLEENARLRALIGLSERLTLKAKAAEISFTAADPYSRKVVINAGAQASIRPGSPVLNEQGLLGQVTRVYPMSSEVTLLVDRDASLAVVNLRTKARSIAVGDPVRNGMNLQFIAGNADVKVGDRLETTGLDGVYPTGMPVGTVVQVERRTKSDFAQVSVATSAASEGVRHVLVLAPLPDPTATLTGPASGAPTPTAKSAPSSRAAAASAPPARPAPLAPGSSSP